MTEANYTTGSPAESPPPGMKIGDIYYVLFRHKWKILLFALVGIAVAAVLFVQKGTTYFSEAKLLVLYVLEPKSAELAGGDRRIQSPSSDGESIINSEIEILTSLDLCDQVAGIIGPEKILGGGETSKVNAASVIVKSLRVEVPKKSNVIKVRFLHPNPEIVQPVLRQLIDLYSKRHSEIHRAVGDLDEILVQQTDQLRSRLVETENNLRKEKTRAGIISLEDTKKAYTEQISKIRLDIFNTEASLAEEQAAIADETGSRPPVKNEAAPAEAGIPTSKVNDYRVIVTRLESLRNQEFELRFQYKDENALVKRVREQIAETEKLKKDMEEKTPKLINTPVPSPSLPLPAAGLADRSARVGALQAKLKVLNTQLEKVRAEAATLDETETVISQLQRKKELEEKNYRYFAASLEQAHFDESLGARKISNISLVQTPSAPARDVSKRFKMVGMALAGGLAAGIGLAFLLELLFDQTLKRPTEVESKLQLPLFFSIPRLARTRGQRALAAVNSSPSSSSALAKPATNGNVVSWPSDPEFRPLIEGLRDRTLMHFQGITHKPKLIGITSCSEGAGVTTIASGLAATLSETGDGSVLLVDLNRGHGAAHPFFRGTLSCGLADALEHGKRESGLISENLYLANANGVTDEESHVLPKRLSLMLPKLKASDYDYIVFDLPLITRASITPRLAAAMDLVLLVIESEKEQQDVLKKARALLMESKANVSAVLNKVRAYVPPWLHKEL